MARLPRITARELARAVQKAGFVFVRQKGSHAIYKHSDGRRTTIPTHTGQIIGPGLLNSILDKDLEVSKEELINLLKK